MDQTLPNPAKATSIDQVLEQLDEIIDRSVSEGDYLCLFAYVYRETTAEIKKSILAGRFENPDRMEKMDIIFASFYINAYYNYYNNKNLSDSWKYAFELSDYKLAAMQHILVGMNTHINLDLAIAAACVSKGTQIITLKNDFMTINQILAELIDRIQDSLSKISFPMKFIDFLGRRNDEKMINFSIKIARDFAWLNALELALVDEAQQKTRIREIDQRVVEISKLITNPPGRALKFLMKFISVLETKNAGKILNKLRQKS
jgi:hypothetical protein